MTQENIDEEVQWQRRFKDPKSDNVLDQLVVEARKDIEEGAVTNYDPASL